MPNDQVSHWTMSYLAFSRMRTRERERQNFHRLRQLEAKRERERGGGGRIAVQPHESIRSTETQVAKLGRVCENLGKGLHKEAARKADRHPPAVTGRRVGNAITRRRRRHLQPFALPLHSHRARTLHLVGTTAASARTTLAS